MTLIPATTAVNANIRMILATGNGRFFSHRMGRRSVECREAAVRFALSSEALFTNRG